MRTICIVLQNPLCAPKKNEMENAMDWGWGRNVVPRSNMVNAAGIQSVRAVNMVFERFQCGYLPQGIRSFLSAEAVRTDFGCLTGCVENNSTGKNYFLQTVGAQALMNLMNLFSELGVF